MNLKITNLIIISLLILIIGCEDNSVNGELPIISTNNVINITGTSATSGGNVSDDGGLTVTSRGVCWSINQNPTINDNLTNDGTGTGNFTSILSDLNVNTTYYIRSYAINSKGTEYGNEINFTTKDGLPTGITTNKITNITTTTATCGGNIIDDGGFSITARGICWSTSTNPTISNEHTIDGSGMGSYSSSISGLSINTIYYVRSYATNEYGTVYGNEQIFRSDRLDITGQTGTLTDYDGNIYNWIGIGKQAWMAENLKVTHYPDGTAIPLVTDSSSWSNLTYPDDAYCYYNNDINYADTYGALYTWSAAKNGASSSSSNPSNVQGACPDGWHLPSREEWLELESYIEADGYSGQEGAALKSTSGWMSNGNGTDIYGFKALPGGIRSHDGSFDRLSDRGYWLSSSTDYIPSAVDVCYLSYYHSSLVMPGGYKSAGLSVRCVKD